MLLSFMNALNSKRIILASGSPRRKQILENVGLTLEIIPSTFEENVDKSKVPLPQDYVVETARLKLEDVATKLSQSKPLPDLLIGADTVVCQDSRIIEKPKDRDDAVSILSSLSGNTHHVYTGVVLAFPANANVALPNKKHMVDGLFQYTTFVECTEVCMTKMSKDVIEAYIDTGEPMDKAGGYGIQEKGGMLVEKIHGDYFNVMGFPLSRFARELADIYQNIEDCPS